MLHFWIHRCRVLAMWFNGIHGFPKTLHLFTFLRNVALRRPIRDPGIEGSIAWKWTCCPFLICDLCTTISSSSALYWLVIVSRQNTSMTWCGHEQMKTWNLAFTFKRKNIGTSSSWSWCESIMVTFIDFWETSEDGLRSHRQEQRHVLLINVNNKSPVTIQTENYGVVGVYFQLQLA